MLNQGTWRKFYRYASLGEEPYPSWSSIYIRVPRRSGEGWHPFYTCHHYDPYPFGLSSAVGNRRSQATSTLHPSRERLFGLYFGVSWFSCKHHPSWDRCSRTQGRESHASPSWSMSTATRQQFENSRQRPPLCSWRLRVTRCCLEKGGGWVESGVITWVTQILTWLQTKNWLTRTLSLTLIHRSPVLTKKRSATTRGPSGFFLVFLLLIFIVPCPIWPYQGWGALNSWPHIEIQQLLYGTNFD